MSAFKTFVFLEYTGEVREDEQMHRTAVIQSVLEEAKLTLESTEIRHTRKANLVELLSHGNGW